MTANKIASLLARVDIKAKDVKVLGLWIHVAVTSEAQAMSAAVLFPAAHYRSRVFYSAITGSWMCAAQVKA